jgi:hypothetical protein
MRTVRSRRTALNATVGSDVPARLAVLETTERSIVAEVGKKFVVKSRKKESSRVPCASRLDPRRETREREGVRDAS